MGFVPVEDVLARLVAWGEAQPSIRALILTSSLVRPGAPVDVLSDYDLIVAATDAERRGHEDDWVLDYGTPMVRWGDEAELGGLTTYFRGVLYDDYVKIDYTLWPYAVLERIAEMPSLPDVLDGGYRILLDKDGRTARWQTPTYRAHVPARPTEAEYRALVEEFWWDATYVAKSLWRDEMVFAKWCLDYDAKNVVLRRLLEWRIEIEHAWSLQPGVLGRGLKRLLPAELWEELASTYVGPEIDENWEALWRTTALFRRVARDVGDALGYAYPQPVDDRVSAYLHVIQRMPGAVTPVPLAQRWERGGEGGRPKPPDSGGMGSGPP
jgi:aminoglycoside 6-adenylyltransferase